MGHKIPMGSSPRHSCSRGLDNLVSKVSHTAVGSKHALLGAQPSAFRVLNLTWKEPCSRTFNRSGYDADAMLTRFSDGTQLSHIGIGLTLWIKCYVPFQPKAMACPSQGRFKCSVTRGNRTARFTKGLVHTTRSKASKMMVLLNLFGSGEGQIRSCAVRDSRLRCLRLRVLPRPGNCFVL
ncbi:hypothetical protein SCLCIDRAFT_934460 [Scleroderma citrinum Foug A]|uniref:Uncharacterized protein n=1 Tax=Scleroderma citrinum Foug A TaxID=1036808 RepID=A0A0C3DXS6_9AGAM|nr:hypothetical protein SCLCIDRAFT_934460 [Scleroderma citrinum Foug A]